MLARVLNLGVVVALIKFSLFTMEELGTWDFLLAATVPLAMLNRLGVTGGLLLTWNDNNSLDRRQRLTSSCFLFQMTLTVMALVLVYLFRGHIARRLGIDSSGPAFFLAVSIALSGSLVLLIQTVLRAERRIWANGMLGLTGGALSPVLGLLAVAVLHMGPEGLLGARLVASLLVVLLGLLTIRKFLRLRFDVHLLRVSVLIGAPYILAFLSRWAINQSDRLFIKGWWSFEEIGAYAVAIKVTALVAMTLAIFQRAWTPWALSVHKEPGAARSFARILVAMSGLSALLALAVALFADELLRLLATAEYVTAASAVVLPLAFAQVFQGLSIGCQIGLGIKRRTGTVGLIYLGGAAVNVALNALLVRRFGIAAAGVTTLAAYAFTALIMIRMSKRVGEMSFKAGRLMAAPLACLMAAVGTRSLMSALEWPLGGIMAAKAAVLVAMILLLWITRLMPGPRQVWAMLRK